MGGGFKGIGGRGGGFKGIGDMWGGADRFFGGGRYQNMDGGRYQNMDSGRYQNMDGGRYQNMDGGRYQNMDGGRYQNMDGGRYGANFQSTGEPAFNGFIRQRMASEQAYFQANYAAPLQSGSALQRLKELRAAEENVVRQNPTGNIIEPDGMGAFRMYAH